MTWNKPGLVVVAAAAVLACGVARDIEGGAPADPAADPVAAGCTSCHGDASQSGTGLSKAAPADGAHLAHVQTNALACSSCHVVPTSVAHSNGTIDVVFGGAATLGGATPAFAAGTCSGVYCHGGTLGAGGNRTTVAWTAGVLACNSCHGAPPPSHAAGSTNCSGCHPGTVKTDGTIDLAGGLHANGTVETGAGGGGGGGVHADGWSDPANHGPAAKQNIGSCQGCHGITFAGGTAGVSCNGCHGGTAWISNCTFCHGTKLATYAAGDLAKAAPPRGTAGETATTARAVGAHQKHLTGGSIGKAIACAECHDVPTDLSHLDGSPAVSFGAAASRNTTPTWNGASCASVYCHGATLAGGTNKAPTWTGGASQVACGTCHGAPPPAPHTTSTACGSCHSGYTSTTANQTLHMNGNVDVLATGSCGSCHAIPPSTGRHTKHVSSERIACGVCHPGYTSSSVNATTHADGVKQVGGTSGWNATTRSCSNSCHGNESW